MKVFLGLVCSISSLLVLGNAAPSSDEDFLGQVNPTSQLQGGFFGQGNPTSQLQGDFFEQGYPTSRLQGVGNSGKKNDGGSGTRPFIIFQNLGSSQSRGKNNGGKSGSDWGRGYTSNWPKGSAVDEEPIREKGKDENPIQVEKKVENSKKETEKISTKETISKSDSQRDNDDSSHPDVSYQTSNYPSRGSSNLSSRNGSQRRSRKK